MFRYSRGGAEPAEFVHGLLFGLGLDAGAARPERPTAGDGARQPGPAARRRVRRLRSDGARLRGAVSYPPDQLGSARLFRSKTGPER